MKSRRHANVRSRPLVDSRVVGRSECTCLCGQTASHLGAPACTKRARCFRAMKQSNIQCRFHARDSMPTAELEYNWRNAYASGQNRSSAISRNRIISKYHCLFTLIALRVDAWTCVDSRGIFYALLVKKFFGSK